MSYQAVDNAAKLTGITSTEKLVLMILCTFHNGDKKSPNYNQCNPSHQTIADRAGLQRQSVSRLILSLTKKGIISYETQKTKGKNTSSRYDLSRFNSNPELHGSSNPELLLDVNSNPELHGSSNPELHKACNIESVRECSVVSACEEKKSTTQNDNSKPANNEKQTITKTPENSHEWIAYFVNVQGFKFHEAQTAKTVPMFVEWVKQGYTIEDVEQGIMGAMGWLSQKGETRANSPCLFDGFIKTAITARQSIQAQKSPDSAEHTNRGSNIVNFKGQNNYDTSRQQQQHIIKETSIQRQMREGTERMQAREQLERDALRHQNDGSIVATYDSHLQPQVDFIDGSIGN